MDQVTTAPSFRDLQLWMKWIITDPRGVQQALANPFPSDLPNIERYTSPKISGLPWISESKAMNKAARIDIYAEAYFMRVHESMKLDFPLTARMLGEVSFQKLVADYLKKFPSQVYNISEIGKSFSKFVESYEDLAQVEFLASLVHMEWLAIESFYAKNTGFIDATKLNLLSDQDWETTSFLIADSIRLVESQWPLDQLWQSQFQDNEFDISLEKMQMDQSYLVIRERGSVSVESLQDSEFEILKALKSGASLINALEEVQNKFVNQDIGSHLMKWFNEWTRRGIIYDLKSNSEKVAL